MQTTVIGSGPAGMTAALLLARQGHAVTLVDRDPGPASGGAWNASIVAEYFHFGGQTFSTVGLGSTISQATDSGNLDLLVAATVAMAGIVVAINRLVWRRLYRLAESRYSLEA